MKHYDRGFAKPRPPPPPRGPRGLRLGARQAIALFVLAWAALAVPLFWLVLSAGDAATNSSPLLRKPPSPTHRHGGGPCSPATVPIPDVDDALYTALRGAEDAGDGAAIGQQLGLIPPPVFVGDHAALCDASLEKYQRWENCLPMVPLAWTRDANAHCRRADRMKLLSLAPGESPCLSSVLHLLLEDVYRELQASGAKPALLFGTLLGAVRDEGIIPWTGDVDLGYQTNTIFDMVAFRRRFRASGYHVFRDRVWRVCVAPTHPLAAVLHAPSADAPVRHCSKPYVDLYAMARGRWPTRLNSTAGTVATAEGWRVNATREQGRVLPDAKVEPYAVAKVFGSAFDTLADPVDFLEREYGAEYLTPPRGRPATDENDDDAAE